MKTAMQALRYPVIAIAVAIASARAASAQVDTTYVAPQLLSRGTASSAVAGPGTVEIMVYVKSDGSGHVQRIIRSTNAADNPAASEIANSSKYVAAKRSGKPTAAFYTYKLSFNGSGMMSDTGTPSGSLTKYDAMVRSGNYAAAKSGLTTYLASSPTDAHANLLLGIADSYSNDEPGAARAFDRAGDIPANYHALAATAYRQAAAQAYSSGEYDAAVSDGRKSIAIVPSPGAYSIVGNAEFQQKSYAAAVADLEKARASLPASTPTHDKAVIEGNLAAAYIAAGQSDQGLALAKDVMTLDPSLSTAVQTTIERYYVSKANDERKAGNGMQSAATLESAAAVVPKDALVLYTQAANDYAAPPKPDYARAKAAAEKALAIAPDDARANYIDGIILVNQNDRQNGLTRLHRADAAAKSANDSELVTTIENAIKTAGP